VYDHGVAQKPKLQIETGRGVLTIDLEIAAGKALRARVDMGEPILEAAKIPTTLAIERVVNAQIADHKLLGAHAAWMETCGLDSAFTCVSMGNPHVIIYCRNVAGIPLEQIGPIVETTIIFPKRINVHFVQVHSMQEVTMRTWERGSGITLACGTGASAVCVAGVLAGKTDRKIFAHLPGGDLELEWRESDNHVYMTGPAAEVFTGDWPD
jgi:diaminopimelate epimerase